MKRVLGHREMDRYLGQLDFQLFLVKVGLGQTFDSEISPISLERFLVGDRHVGVHVAENLGVLSRLRVGREGNLMNEVNDSIRAFSEFLDDLELLVFVVNGTVCVCRKEGNNVALEEGTLAYDVARGEHILCLV